MMGVLTDSRHNERNEGDGAAIKMMGLCISHMSTYSVMSASINGREERRGRERFALLIYVEQNSRDRIVSL